MSKLMNSIYTPNRSGRLGGTVFSSNKAGYYEKMFKKPANPKTVSQMIRRASLAELTRSWGTLTDAQRLTWNSDEKVGFELYVKLNSSLQCINEPIITANPIITYPSSILGCSVDVVTTPGSEDMTLTLGTVIGASEKLVLFASAPNKKPGRKLPVTALRQIAVLDNTFVSGGSFMTAYTAKFGEMPVTGQKALFAWKKVVKVSGYSSLLITGEAKGAV